MVGASLQSSQVDIVQGNTETSRTTTESSKNVNEMVGYVQEVSTDDVKQTRDEVRPESSSTTNDE